MEVNRQNFTRSLKDYMFSCGASLVGVGAMEGVANCQYPYAVSLAIPLPKDIVLSLQAGPPTQEYYQVYTQMNDRLNGIARAGERYLQEQHFRAYAMTTDRVETVASFTTLLPHKTAATRAGLGWIGKNCLLVTEKYGSAIRLTTIYTDAPLQADAPIVHSKCGSCGLCVEACPGNALKGTLWEPGKERSEIADVDACYQAMVSITQRSLGREVDICGRCFAVCRYTRKYLSSDNACS